MSNETRNTILVAAAIAGVYFAYKTYQNSQNPINTVASEVGSMFDVVLNTVEDSIGNIWHDVTGNLNVGTTGMYQGAIN